MWKHLQRLLPLHRANSLAVNRVQAVLQSVDNCNLNHRFTHTLTSALGARFLQPWRKSEGERNVLHLNSTTLTEVVPYTPTRGMKIVGRVRRRCKDCQLIWEDGILYNLCKTHPRHKQKLKPQYWENLRILTHATAHTKRPW